MQKYFNVIKEKIKIFFYLLIKSLKWLLHLREYILRAAGAIFPPLGIVLKIRDSLLNYFDKENILFRTKMPKWYSFIDNSLFMRIVRVISGLWLIAYANKHFQNILRILFQERFEIDPIIYITPTLQLIGEIFTAVSLVFFISFSFLKFILGIRYFKELTYNSPFSAASCGKWIFSRVCNVSFVAGVFGFGSSFVDITAQKRGYVEPFDGFFQSATYYATGRITPQMASNPSKNLVLLNGDEFPGATIIREHGQLNTLKIQEEHARIFEARRAIEETRNESANLIQNNQYKRD